MHLSYEKLGLDDPMVGKAEYKVMDGMNPVCYKTANGYVPIAGATAIQATANEAKTAEQKTQTLYVLRFKINGDVEEMTFMSKKKLDNTVEVYREKSFVTDIEIQQYQILV